MSAATSIPCYKNPSCGDMVTDVPSARHGDLDYRSDDEQHIVSRSNKNCVDIIPSKNPSCSDIDVQSICSDSDISDIHSDLDDHLDDEKQIVVRGKKNHDHNRIIKSQIKSLKALPPEEQVPLVLAFIEVPNDEQEMPLNMAVTQHNYARVQHIFRLILSIKNPEDRFELLKIALTTTSTQTGMTPLMWVAHKNHPKWVRYIICDVLNGIKHVKDRLGLLETLLTNKSHNGSTVLRYAAEASVQSAQEILEVIFSIQDDETRFKLLTTILMVRGDKEAITLMFAAANQPECVKYILDKVLSIKNDNIRFTLLRDMLLAKQNKGWTALMFAARYQPEAVKYILGAVCSIKDSDKRLELLREVLLASNHNGCTTLMLAAANQPEAVQCILDTVCSIKNPDESFQLLREMLLARDNDRSTILMWAACNYPKAVQYILDTVCSIKIKNPDKPLELLCEMLLASNGGRSTALMCAARFQPEAVKCILGAVCSIESPDQSLRLLREMLLASNRYGETALIIAAQYQPEAVKLILENVIRIPKLEARLALLTTILETGDRHRWTPLKMALCAHHFQTMEYIFKILLQQGSGLFMKIISKTPHDTWSSQYVKGYYSTLYLDGRKPEHGTPYTDKSKITKYGFYHDLGFFAAVSPKIIRAIPKQQHSLLFEELKKLQQEWAVRGQAAINAVVLAGKNLVGNSSSTALNRVVTDIMMLYIMGAAFEQFKKQMQQVVSSKGPVA